MMWQGLPVIVRRNPRAKQVWLRVRACQGLEVVLPYRISVAELPTILQRHAAWIQERLAWLAARGEAPGQPILPEDIHLPFVGQSFRLVRENAREALLLAGPEELRLCLPETEHGVELVQQWLIGIGKQYLVPFCRQVAAEIGMPIGRIQVRNQESRWGSCSKLSGISLNAKLLFLPEPLVRHVVVHELCHVPHRNHGPQFKAMLRSLDPRTDAHETLLRHAWNQIPAWTKWRAQPRR